jgi:hypothetical protein
MHSEAPWLYPRKDHLPVIGWFEEKTRRVAESVSKPRVAGADPLHVSVMLVVVAPSSFIWKKKGGRLLGNGVSRVVVVHGRRLMLDQPARNRHLWTRLPSPTPG